MRVFVSRWGAPLVVRVDAPETDVVIAHDQVGQVVSVAGTRLLLLVGFVDVVAVGPEGIAWRSPRLAVDDLRVTRADIDGIRCTAEVLTGSLETIVLDPVTGQVSAGPRLEGPPWN